jgi:transcription-repair coupling factor (superfamily II helicase)
LAAVFEERLETLFDHLAVSDIVLRDGGTDGAVAGRREAIQDYFSNRERAMVAEPGSYRPLAPSSLYLGTKEWDGLLADRPVHLPRPSQSLRRAK